jgi:hypothetical protein
MCHKMCHKGLAVIGVGAAIVVLTPAPANATRPLPEPPITRWVEVEVPVDDTLAELVQMHVAAAVGAAIAARATALRLRRRQSALRPPGGLIDLGRC